MDMDPQKKSQRKPTIILKFKNSTEFTEQAEDDELFSDDDDHLDEGFLRFGSYVDGDAGSGVIKKKKTVVAGSGSGEKKSCLVGEGVTPPMCQVDNCNADLSVVKRYYQRHKICEVHAKTPVVIVAGTRKRFCQQCSRFQELSEFDAARRSCRSRLAGHNERRRKSSSEAAQVDVNDGSMLQTSSPAVKENQSSQVGEKGIAPMALHLHGKQFQIR